MLKKLILRHDYKVWPWEKCHCGDKADFMAETYWGEMQPHCWECKYRVHEICGCSWDHDAKWPLPTYSTRMSRLALAITKDPAQYVIDLRRKR